MDDGSAVLNWVKDIALTIFLGLLSLLAWYFKRSNEKTDERISEIDRANEALEREMHQRATREELNALREATEAKHATLERDIKNLGQQFSEVVRREIDMLRQDQTRQNIAMTERFDKLLLMMSNKNQSGQ